MKIKMKRRQEQQQQQQRKRPNQADRLPISLNNQKEYRQALFKYA
jgi:hypothetical protein